jgi:hypothetical protein
MEPQYRDDVMELVTSYWERQSSISCTPLFNGKEKTQLNTCENPQQVKELIAELWAKYTEKYVLYLFIAS